MKAFTVQRFKCETCGEVYETEASAKRCESKPVTQDKNAKVGDAIRIIRGDGQGLATVEGRHIYSKEWGHYAWERYWHTVGLTAKCLEDWGHRQLTFDDYEVIPAASTTTRQR